MSFTKSRASASLVTKKGNRKSHLFSFLSLLDVSFRQFFISVLVSEFHKCDNCLEATKLLIPDYLHATQSHFDLARKTAKQLN